MSQNKTETYVPEPTTENLKNPFSAILNSSQRDFFKQKTGLIFSISQQKGSA